MDKTKIEIKEFVCPFCNYKEILTTTIEKRDEENNFKEEIGIDYWDCPKCGAENNIGLEIFEKDFKIKRE